MNSESYIHIVKHILSQYAFDKCFGKHLFLNLYVCQSVRLHVCIWLVAKVVVSCTSLWLCQLDKCIPIHQQLSCHIWKMFLRRRERKKKKFKWQLLSKITTTNMKLLYTDKYFSLSRCFVVSSIIFYFLTYHYYLV